MKNKFVSSILLASAITLAGTAIANAEMVFTGNAGYYNDATYGGIVFKIGYGGTGSGTLAEGKTWTISNNVLIGCCPNNYQPTFLHIYGTANTQKNVYVSAISRSGHCYVDGGTWNCGGMFQLGMQTMGTVTLRNKGTLTIEDSFRLNYGSSVTVNDSSVLKLTLESDGTFGNNGGIYVYSDAAINTITLAKADNLVIETTEYTNAADQFVLENFLATDQNIKPKLSSLSFSVNGNTFTADDESALNRHLSGISVLGYENYEKKFVVNAETQSVALHLSKIPEPSAFGLLAGLGALACVASRRRRQL